MVSVSCLVFLFYFFGLTNRYSDPGFGRFESLILQALLTNRLEISHFINIGLSILCLPNRHSKPGFGFGIVPIIVNAANLILIKQSVNHDIQSLDFA